MLMFIPKNQLKDKLRKLIWNVFTTAVLTLTVLITLCITLYIINIIRE